MISRIAAIICTTLILAPITMAQESDPIYNLLTQNRHYECLEFSVNARNIVPDYYQDGKVDSALMILEYVERNCEKNMFAFSRLLMEIKLGQFSENWCDTMLTTEMFDPFGRFSKPYPKALRMFSEDEVDKIDSKYASFIDETAAQLAHETPPNSTSHAICLYMSRQTDILYKELSQNQYRGTCVQDAYEKRLENLKSELTSIRGHWAVSFGGWIPQGAPDVVGEKIEIGGALGARGNQWGTDLIFRFGVLNTSTPFLVKNGDNLRLSDKAISIAQFGLNVNYELFRRGRLGLDCFGGVAYGGLVVIRESDSTKAKTIGSLVASAGISPRIFYNRQRSRFLGLEMRCDLMNFKNKGGARLSGAAFSINMIWGFLANAHSVGDADRLHYYDRKR